MYKIWIKVSDNNNPDHHGLHISVLALKGLCTGLVDNLDLSLEFRGSESSSPESSIACSFASLCATVSIFIIEVEEELELANSSHLGLLSEFSRNSSLRRFVKSVLLSGELGTFQGGGLYITADKSSRRYDAFWLTSSLFIWDSKTVVIGTGESSVVRNVGTDEELVVDDDAALGSATPSSTGFIQLECD